MLGDPSHVVARYGSMQERDAAAFGAPVTKAKPGGAWMLWAGLSAVTVAVVALMKRRR